MARDRLFESVYSKVAESAAPLPTVLPDPLRTILAVERLAWTYPGLKESFIREHLGMSRTEYFQLWNRMIGDEALRKVDPFTIDRWRRIRSSRQSTRSARRLGIDA